MLRWSLLLTPLLLAAAVADAHDLPTGGPRLGVFRQVAGELRTVEVRPGDTLVGIASRVGVPWTTLARENGIQDPDRIYPGQELRVDTRRVVPALADDGWVINVPEATLYVFEDGRVTARYPVGLGRPAWPTPLGSFRILFREENPTWEVPPSIQEEMRRENRVVRQKVPPGPDNPLGRYWIQLSVWGYGVHGTPFPTSVGQFLSHGCIRARDGDIDELFGLATRGTRVEIAYLPVKLAVTPEGEVWAEAHPDVYGLGFPTEKEVWQALQEAGVTDRVDREALRTVLRQKDGVARRVGLPPPQAGSDPASQEGADAFAVWQCLDCPPGPQQEGHVPGGGPGPDRPARPLPHRGARRRRPGGVPAPDGGPGHGPPGAGRLTQLRVGGARHPGPAPAAGLVHGRDPLLPAGRLRGPRAEPAPVGRTVRGAALAARASRSPRRGVQAQSRLSANRARASWVAGVGRSFFLTANVARTSTPERSSRLR
ncbi:L,D-transpeptidase family protein [Deferrisoma camini]|uniref:L,D-transpeptidase family protein n=1 Tax=Deferrisoma camini TaxID=1035120 RepID=UPI000A073C4E|nr:L,D-transpeptidase family protein [Deferrisoma camini]